MVPVTLALLAGLAAGFMTPVAPAAPATAAALCLAWAGGRLWRSRRIRGPLPGSGAAGLLALALLGWAWAASLAAGDRAALEALAPWTAEELVAVEGTLAAEPRVAPDRVDLELEEPRVSALRVGGGTARLGLKVAVGVMGEPAATMNREGGALPLPGQRVRVWGRLRPILPPTAPGPFDPERAALSKGIGARLTVVRAGDVELGPVPRGVRASFFGGLRRVRGAIVEVLAARLPAGQMPMARALLLGDAHLVPVPERDAYALTGLAHLLAVSGLNTAFALAIALMLARLAWLPPRACALTGMLSVLGYAALTGFAPPVARAAVMGAFILGGLMLKRTTSALASWATAVCGTLLWDPRNLLRVDWQLSYACVLTIVVLMPPIHDFILRGFRPEAPAGGAPEPPGGARRLLQRWVLLPLAGVTAVHLGILPLQIALFRQYNLLSPFYNLLACELSLWVMLGVMLAALLGWIPFLGALSAMPAQWGLSFQAWLVSHMAAIPHVTMTLTPLPPLLVAAYYVLLLGGSWLRGGGGRAGLLDRSQIVSFTLTLGLLFGLLTWSQAVTAPAGDGRTLDLYLLDVGQGDCEVARFPNGKLLVVDAGPVEGASDRGRQTVGPFLKTLGVEAIDCLAASHADADHIGGIPYLLEHFDVRLMLEGPDTAGTDLFRTMRADERARGVDVRIARQGGEVEGFAPARIRMLGPVPGMQDNNASLVMLLEYGKVRILLTGDLEAAGEEALIRDGLAEDIDILKLGHHGSRSSTSDALLEQFKPEVALISVGQRNRYGHPAPEVLRRLEAHGIAEYRTDRLGTIWIRTDGRRIEVYRYAGR